LQCVAVYGIPYAHFFIPNPCIHNTCNWYLYIEIMTSSGWGVYTYIHVHNSRFTCMQYMQLIYIYRNIYIFVWRNSYTNFYNTRFTHMQYMQLIYIYRNNEGCTLIFINMQGLGCLYMCFYIYVYTPFTYVYTPFSVYTPFTSKCR